MCSAEPTVVWDWSVCYSVCNIVCVVQNLQYCSVELECIGTVCAIQYVLCRTFSSVGLECVVQYSVQYGMCHAASLSVDGNSPNFVGKA